MSSELKYKIADKVVFQKVKTALGKNKSFIGLILKVLDWLKAEIHREMVKWPYFRNGFAILLKYFLLRVVFLYFHGQDN